MYLVGLGQVLLGQINLSKNHDHRCHYWPPRTHYCCHHRSSAIFIPQPPPLMGTFVATKCQKIIFLVTIILQENKSFFTGKIYFMQENILRRNKLRSLKSCLFTFNNLYNIFKSVFFSYKQGCPSLFEYVTIPSGICNPSVPHATGYYRKKSQIFFFFFFFLRLYNPTCIDITCSVQCKLSNLRNGLG